MSNEIDDDVESSFTRIKQFLELSIPSFETGRPTGGQFVSARDSILRQVTDAYTSPLTDALSVILKRNVGEAKARELLFAPVFSDESITDTVKDGMALYPILISGPPQSQGGASAPTSHPARRVQSISMFLLYISHLRYWQRARAFVLAGGLQSLVDLFNCDNVAIKSQAIDSFQQISGHPAFDWFAGRGDNASEGQEELFKPLQLDADESKLHSMMLSLGRPPSPLISSLLSNFNSPSWPGGSFLSLQVLAFWLSWARRLHCNGGPLSVSSKVIEALKLWSEREGKPEIERDGDEYVIQSSTTQRYSEREERTLAKQLFEDFSRFPAPVEDVQRSLTSSSSAVSSFSVEANHREAIATSTISGLSSPDIPKPLPELSTSPLTTTSSSSSSIKPLSIQDQVLFKKELGNVRFRESNWVDALREYTAAISLLDAAKSGKDKIQMGQIERNSLMATLYSNRAAAHLRASGYGGDLSPSPSYFASISELLRAPAQRLLRNRIFMNDRTFLSKDINVEKELIKNAPFSVRCLLFCIGDATAAMTIDPSHGKSLLRKSQALAALGQFDAAAAVARACIAAASGGGGRGVGISGKISELRTNASSFLTFIMALQTQVEEEEEEEEEKEKDTEKVTQVGAFNDSVLLDALLSREEFGGGLGRTISETITIERGHEDKVQNPSLLVSHVGPLDDKDSLSSPLASLTDVLSGTAKGSSGKVESKKSSIPLHLRALMK